MAYAKPRSANAELEAGMTDGKYKKVVMDRGGVVESATYASRRDLSDVWHGIHEAPTMETPDGATTVNPYAVSTPHADPEGF